MAGAYDTNIYVHICTHDQPYACTVFITQYGSTVYIGMALVWPAL